MKLNMLVLEFQGPSSPIRSRIIGGHTHGQPRFIYADDV